METKLIDVKIPSGCAYCDGYDCLHPGRHTDYCIYYSPSPYLTCPLEEEVKV